MVIKFRCPNGHPLAASENRVGRSGQCPRCQAQFVVPAPDGPARARAVPTSASTEPRATPELHSADPTGNTFLFLCPNGHKLYGSPTLQGKTGQCPHCNSRFLIPAANDAPAEDAHQEAFFDALDSSLPDSLAWDAAEAEPEAEADESSEELGTYAEEDEPRPSTGPVPVSCHPLAQLIRRLGSDSRARAPLELKLADGSTLQVRAFSAELSQHEYGVFATRDADHADHVVIIAWGHITRVTIPVTGPLPADLG